MNFLAPWFFLGAVVVAGPIVFHLIRRVSTTRISFSSLMFLRPTPPRVTRRRRLEHIWLLLLRCLCLLLLATAFARPFFSTNNILPAAASENRQLILLVDTSASMRRVGAWQSAAAIAARYLDRTLPGDQVAVMTFDRQPKMLFNFADWTRWSPDQRAGLARQRLGTALPGWMTTQLGLALTSAAEQFVDDSANGKPAGRRELVLISDMQEGAKLDGLQGHDWPNGVRLIVETVEVKARANAGLEIVSDAGTARAAGKDVRVRVTNARDSDREKFQLAWDMSSPGPSNRMEVYLPPGQTRTLAMGNVGGKLQLTGDEVDFDNASYYAAPEAERVSIAWFGTEAANDPERLRYYVQRVFPGSPQRKIEIAPPTVQTVFSPDALNQAAFAVIPGRLTEDESKAVRGWLTSGKSALLVLTDPQMGPTLAALTGLSDARITEAAGDYVLLGSIDFTHPLFAPFADPRFSDFTHIHFWKHRCLEIPQGAAARVLAKFDDGSPALAQFSVGKGNLIVLAAGWNPADSQFAVSSKFPPFMETLLDWSGASAAARFQFQTGESIPSPIAAGEAVQWRKPDGTAETLAAGVPFTATDLPGIYTAHFGTRERRVAMNLSLEESRTAPMSQDELARLGVPLQTSAAQPTIVVERQRHWQQSELENHQKLWRWLIVGALAVMLGEILLGGVLARRRQTVEGMS